MEERSGRCERHGETGARTRGSRWLAWFVALSLVVQGFSLAAQRVIPGGHFHLVPVAHSHGIGADHDRHDHGGGHFHALIDHHDHHAREFGVVYVDDQRLASDTATTTVVKRVALDLEQLAGVTILPGLALHRRAPPASLPRAFISHVAERLDRPPRQHAL